MAARGRQGLLKVFIVAIVGVVAMITLRSCFKPVLRVGTFNIRAFGKEEKDLERLQAVIEETHSDVLALQEMQDEKSVRDLATRLSHDGRRYQFELAECGGRSNMQVGFLFDETRVALTRTKEYPEQCGVERSVFAARFEPVRGRPFQLLVVHFVKGGDKKQQDKRRDQWREAHRIAAELAKETPVAILGDTNSTGFLDDKHGERTFVLEEAKRAGLGVATENLKCTEYWQPEKQYVPSVLDHVVASPELARSAEVHGYCKRLACAVQNTEPEDFKNVSDHCPVTVDVR